MRILDGMLGFRLSAYCGSAAFLDAAPFVSVRTPPPAMGAYPPRKPRKIGGRARIATCGGVAWLGDRHLLAVNLRGDVMHVWNYTSNAPPEQVLSNARVVPLERFEKPENLAVSPDGSLVAVTFRVGPVNIYSADPEAGTVSPRPVLEVGGACNNNPHGVAFSPYGDFLAYTTIVGKGIVRICRLRRDRPRGAPTASETMVFTSPWSHLKPKGVSFSPDGRFLAIGYGPNAALLSKRLKKPGSTVRVYRFDRVKGTLEPDSAVAIPRRNRFVCVEDVSFLADGTGIVATDQGADRAVIVSFDASTGSVGARRQVLRPGLAELSFPHGCAVAPDGLYVAIACYGTDRTNLYRLHYV